MKNDNNLGLMSNKKVEIGEFAHSIIYRGLTESHAVSIKEINYLFPLYLYPEESNQISTENSSTKRTPNLNLKIVDEIAKKLGLTFVEDHEILKQVQHDKFFSPLDLLDYIYAVLHSPTYRDKYKEFLKIDFPRVPYPKDAQTFWQLVVLGGELRQLHLLESDTVNDFITNYTGEGDNIITRKITKTDIGYEPNVSSSAVENTSEIKGKVWINDTQYFDNVPLIAWEFYIGGYQPAQKWLKDRKGRVLEHEDIFHYSKIIVSLTETHSIMQAINAIEIE
jgi:predicted helicase